MERLLALVVDEDPTERARIREAFESQDVDARGASSGAETMEALRTRPVRFITVGVDTPGVETDALLDHATRLRPPPVVIVIDDDGERGVRLFDRGAFDVVSRPLDDARLLLIVRRAVRHAALLDEMGGLRRQLQSREGYHGIVGRSRPIERLRDQLARLAGCDRSVWFHGEIGCGRELAARTLHGQSARARARFGVLPCAEIDHASWKARLGLGPDGSLAANGLLAQVDGGTLYIEDPPALSPELQSGLLAELKARAAGGIDVRLLASSTADPGLLADEGRLIDELRHWMAQETIGIPPLRERVEDIALLARHFILTICSINHLPPIQLAPEALELLERHRWPDNVQGLRNAMEQAVILCPDDTIRLRDLPDRLREAVAAGAPPTETPGSGLRRFRDAKREVVESFERSYLSRLMERHGGNVTAAAHQAGMLRSALQRLLRKYGLKSAEFRRQQRRPQQAEKAARPPR